VNCFYSRNRLTTMPCPNIPPLLANRAAAEGLCSGGLWAHQPSTEPTSAICPWDEELSRVTRARSGLPRFTKWSLALSCSRKTTCRPYGLSEFDRRDPIRSAHHRSCSAVSGGYGLQGSDTLSVRVAASRILFRKLSQDVYRSPIFTPDTESGSGTYDDHPLHLLDHHPARGPRATDVAQG
jgi:hypothetical protein